MTNKAAIIYATVDGQTLKISNKIKDEFFENNRELDLISIDDFNEDIRDYELVIIGSSIRYGLHNNKIISFINRNKQQLESKKTAFFSVNLVARKEEKCSPETNTYVVKFFKSITWKPNLVTVFAGKLDYKKYSFFDRIMIQFIMWMTKGPTNKNTNIEYTNWNRVREFALQLQNL